MNLPSTQTVFGLKEKDVENVVRDFLDHLQMAGYNEDENIDFTIEQYMATFG